MKLTSSQRRIAKIIDDEARAWDRRVGLGRPEALSAVLGANAYAESAFDPSAIGDGGTSIGLFQLHVGGGLADDVLSGRLPVEGLTLPAAPSALADPRTNVRAILAALERQPRAIDALRNGSIADAVAAFVRYIEKPADWQRAAQLRTAYAVAFAGRPADTLTIDLEPLA